MSTIVSGSSSKQASGRGAAVYSKSYYTIVEFAKFLRDNGDKLFEKDAKLCLKTDQIFILQEYLQQIVSSNSTSSSSLMVTSSEAGDGKMGGKKKSITTATIGQNNREFLLLYKSNQLHLIQDFLFKITNLKIVSEIQFNTMKDYVKLSMYGSLTYLEIKNCPINNVLDLQNLRNQLEVLICVKSLNKLQDLLQLCGADQSSPLNWPKLHTLNLSHNELTTLDSSFRLTTSIEILDLSHNNLKDCGTFLHSLTKLKRLNLSFNKLKSLPDLSTSTSQMEYLDLSFNSVEKIQIENVSKLTQLKHINLSHNLINDLIEINHLRLLASINQIKLDANPVKLDAKCDMIVKEILDVVAVKNNIKNKSNPNWNSSNIYIRQTSSSRASAPRITINKRESSLTTSVPLAGAQQHSMPNNLFLANRRQNSFTTMPRKLRAHNVLIEQDDSDDYYIVNNKNTEEHNVDSMANQVNDISGMKFLSTSIGDYDSSKLQSELENLKKMRQNYGTEWLISTPSFVEITKLMPAQRVVTEQTTNSTNENKQKEDSEIPPSLPVEDTEQGVVESFAVYKSVLSNSSPMVVNFELDLEEEASSKTIMCFLTITERQLIEKDETNTQRIGANELSDLESIEIVPNNVDQEVNQLKVKFKSQEKGVVYQFENSHEINSFVDSLRVVLLNEANFDSCSIYYCLFCSEFGTKSLLKLPELDTKTSLRNLTCTKCSSYVIKDNVIQTKSSPTSPDSKPIKVSFTLKEALESMKPLPPVEVEEEIGDTSKESVHQADSETSQLSPTSSEQINELDERLKSLMNTTQISKVKLDEINSEARRINNNLKLYLIINYFNQQQDATGDEESLICIYKLQKIVSSQQGGVEDKQRTPESNCLCVLTNKRVLVFKVVDQELYADSSEFDKCLRIEYSFSVNQIEYIDVALGQHYFQLEVVIDEESAQPIKQFFKLITMDVYQTQAYINTLLKIINESKNFPILKQIRKNNESTNQNLSLVVSKLEGEKVIGRMNSSQVNLFTFVDSFKLNIEEIQSQRAFDPETSCLELFIYNNERVLIVEENLCYFQHQSSASSQQFNLIESSRISDIVHLKLFKENENQLEINIVDEMRNSKQINWSFNLNKQFLLSQLISILKENWEKIFFVELPINF